MVLGVQDQSIPLVSGGSLFDILLGRFLMKAGANVNVKYEGTFWCMYIKAMH